MEVMVDVYLCLNIPEAHTESLAESQAATVLCPPSLLRGASNLLARRAHCHW